MMNRAALTIAASVVLLPATPYHGIAQTGFNGVIVFTTHNENGRDGTLTQTTSGNKLFLQSSDMGGSAGGGIIIDGDAHTVTMVMAAQQQYMTMTEDEIKQRAGMMGGMGGANETADGTASVVNTGRTETIAGVPCDVYHVSGTGANGHAGEGEVCVAKGVGFAINEFMSGLGRMGGRANTVSPMLNQVRDLLKDGKGVLKVTQIKNGQTTVLLVATKIDRTPPASTVFAPPPGYTQLQMPAGAMPGAMPGGMPGGMKPPG